MKTPGYDAAKVAERIQQLQGGVIRPTARGGYLVRCPAHEDRGPSLSITPIGTEEVRVHCFGGCDSGTLVKAVNSALRLDAAEVARSIEAGSNKPVLPTAQRYDARPRLPRGFKPKPRAFDHPFNGAPTKVWVYRLPDGVAGYVARYDTDNGKEFAPFAWAFDRKENRERLAMCAPSPRPFYHLDRIIGRPNVPILWTEGEKAADAAAKLFPHWQPTTTMNGGASVHLTDFSPCRGRTFIVAPDEDAPGYGAANTAARLAVDAGAAEVLILMPPTGFNVVAGQLVEGEYRLLDGDDADDHANRGWTGELWAEAARRSGHPMLRRLILPEAVSATA